MPKLTIGQLAPLFTLPDLDNSPISLEQFRGGPVVINFWSAECPWVERADLEIASWQDRLTVLPIAVNVEEPYEMLAEAAAERGLRYILRDTDRQVAGLYGAEVTPHFFLVDGDGILRYQGAFDDMTFRQKEPARFYLIEAIQALMIGDPIPIAETQPYGCAISTDSVE